MTTEHLLIDGYNVIHDWPEVRGAMKRDINVACRKLADRVRILHDFEGIRVTIVFDGRGEGVEIERPGKELTFSLVYAPTGSSADEIIVQLVRTSKDPGKLTVVSRDGLIRNLVREGGSRVYSPGDLLDRIEACERRQSQALSRRSREVEKEWRETKRGGDGEKRRGGVNGGK